MDRRRKVLSIAVATLAVTVAIPAIVFVTSPESQSEETAARGARPVVYRREWRGRDHQADARTVYPQADYRATRDDSVARHRAIEGLRVSLDPVRDADLQREIYPPDFAIASAPAGFGG